MRIALIHSTGPLSWCKHVLIALHFIALGAGAVQANGLAALEHFVKTVKSGQAEFTQTVTSPTRAGESPRRKTSSGRFEFQRPGKFRFHYQKPFEQLILADTVHLWIYDADLNQASQRKQSLALANTPAALIASATDLAALQREFHLEDAPDQDGLAWVVAKPKASDSTIQSVRIGFRGQALQQLDILDSFGQRSEIHFAAMQINLKLPDARFQFSLPAQAELIK